MITMVIVRTQIKEVVREFGLGIDNVSTDFLERLDNKVKLLIRDACQRAKENGRKTVMGKDL
jgi:histone H3/H4